MSAHLCQHESLALTGQVSKASIDALTTQIKSIEAHVEKQYKMEPGYVGLQSLPGVGKILGLTIMLETGPISRFPQVGNYVSYCRKADSTWKSAEKVKGKGNIKNGNRYLSWAFAEAAEHARMFDTASRNFYTRKVRERNGAVAHGALANKLARAAYYIIRYRRNGCRRHLSDILIPMGAWCSNTSIEPLEYAAKATGGTKSIRQNRVWRGGGNFVKKKVAGRSSFS